MKEVFHTVGANERVLPNPFIVSFVGLVISIGLYTLVITLSCSLVANILSGVRTFVGDVV
jgi:hypothetical protein